jgi:hypothetical protein
VFYAERYVWLGYLEFVVVSAVAVVSLYRLSRHGNLLSFIVKRIFKRFK